MNYVNPYDLVDGVTRETLLCSYDILYNYHLNNVSPIRSIFSQDPVVEKKKVLKLLKSFYHVIKWFSTEEQILEFKKPC